MREYKGYNHTQRMNNLGKVKQLIAEGVLESPYKKKCEICGQDKGIREYHCVDYSDGTNPKNLKCLCWKCHRMLHVFEIGEVHKYYKNAKEYFERVKSGHIYTPVMKYNEFDWDYENQHWGETNATK